MTDLHEDYRECESDFTLRHDFADAELVVSERGKSEHLSNTKTLNHCECR